MAGAETTIERLRHYLSQLKPQARSLLIGELERSVLRGEEAAGADPALQELLLGELRRIVRSERTPTPRTGDAARLFFKPLEPFLVDDRADHKHQGRIARGSIETLWTWIRRDLMREEAAQFSDAVGHILRAGDGPQAEHLARDFQDRAAATIDAALAAASDEKTHRRLLAQIGTPRASEDAMTLKSVLQGRDVLATFAAHLPLRIGNLAGERLDECKALVDGLAAREPSLMPYGLLVVMNRLAAPWQLIRLGVKAAGTDIAARIAETPYGVTVPTVLAELDRMIGELRDDLRGGQGVAVGALLKAVHDAARGLRTEIDLPADSTWGRALAAQRAQVSGLVRSQIEAMPARVRRLLRPRPRGEISANGVLDRNEAAETAALVEFVGACRNFAGELALNEMTQRTCTDLQLYLDSATRVLLDGLRQATGAERLFRQSQLDAAVELCSRVFGAEYAAVLGKAAEVARADERRLAHA